MESLQPDSVRKPLEQMDRLAKRDQVVLEHMALVKAIAMRVHDSLPVHVDLDDLIHAGVIGLFDAATKYDESKEIAFSAYAKHRVKGAILDSLRQLDWASRDLRRRHKQVEAVTRQLTAALNRPPTEAELAEGLGVTVERWRQMAIDLRNTGVVSADTRPDDQEKSPALDFPCLPSTHPDAVCAQTQMRNALSGAIKTLPERYQQVVEMYYSGEKTMKEIGTLLGINESRVSQIHKAALEKMQTVLESTGITSSQMF